MNKTTTLSFNSQGIAASDERLASIAMDCINRERAMREALLRDLEEDCVRTYGVLNINDQLTR